MNCDSSNWTVEFPRSGFEIRPYQFELKKTRSKYDYFRGKFSTDVGQQMKQATSVNGSSLREKQPAVIKHNGQAIRRLMFRPDFVRYSMDETEIELKDLQKMLSSGTVNIQRRRVLLRAIYAEIIEKAETDIFGPLTEENFNLPENQIRALLAGQNEGSIGGKFEAVGDFVDWFTDDPPDAEAVERQLDPDNYDSIPTRRVIDSEQAIDFESITPEEAIQRLNKLFGLKSWVNNENKLIIGEPSVNGIRHIAAPNDTRVWRYKDPKIRHPRNPIKSVRVVGDWVRATSKDAEDIIENTGDKIPFIFNNETAGNDAREYGIAERQDVDYGEVIEVEAKYETQTQLKTLARQQLKQEMKDQNTGSVEIDPALSGEEQSRIIEIEAGDILQIIPHDAPFDNPGSGAGGQKYIPDPDEVCGGFVHNEIYLVEEVSHKKTKNGDWQLHLDIGMYPTFESDQGIESYITYYDPRSNRFFDAKVGDEDFEGGKYGPIGSFSTPRADNNN